MAKSSIYVVLLQIYPSFLLVLLAAGTTGTAQVPVNCCYLCVIQSSNLRQPFLIKLFIKPVYILNRLIASSRHGPLVH